MRIVYSWLTEYVDAGLEPKKLAELLTMSGLSVESVAAAGSDHLLEVEVTSNRPDCLSVIGVAREVAALTGKKLKMPHVAARRPQAPRSAPATGVIDIVIKEKALCPAYTGRVIEGVKIAPSQKEVRSRIEAMGLRPVNNVVDITNFCLFELGEPMHAFDLKKIEGGKIVVRRAVKGEKIVTIDGVERVLDEETLVIADAKKAIAIAGIIGGKETEVTDDTRSILLEAAIFDPISIRRTARRLGLGTDSSYRFERRIDPAVIVPASLRAAALIEEASGGLGGAFIECGEKKAVKRYAVLRYQKLDDLLGIEVPHATVAKILISLGCAITGNAREGVKVEVPTFRQDIENEIDLIEEVARINGYDAIPVTVPPIAVTAMTSRPPAMVLEGRLAEIAKGLGLAEALTYSLLPRRECALASAAGDGALVEVANPLSAEQEVMRPDLAPGLMKTIAYNINRKARSVAFFEIGAVYAKRDTQEPSEMRRLSVGITGETRGSWREGPRNVDFFDLKGILETVFAGLRLPSVTLERYESGLFAPGAAAAIRFNSSVIGTIGEASHDLLALFDIKQRVYFFELALEPLVAAFKPYDPYAPMPRYPSVVRDLSIVVDAAAESGRLSALIRESGGALIRNIEVIDHYTGTQIPNGKKGITYRLEYLDPARTLEEADVARAHSAVIERLGRDAGAVLR